MRPILACALVVLQLVGCRTVPNGETAGWVVLRDVTVIDGTGAPAQPHQTILLRGDRIARIGPMSHVEPPAGAAVLDVAGLFVIPGLIDLHVHLPEDRDVQAAMLARLLEFGVTTILNPGARHDAGVELRARLERGEVRGPRMLTAGRIVDFDPPTPGIAHWAARVGDGARMRREVRAQVARGVDFVKLYAKLPPGLLEVGVDEATRAGVPVVAHTGATTWAEAARAGVSMLVHSGYGTPMESIMDVADPARLSDAEWYEAFARAPRGRPFAELVELLVEGDVTVVPTLSITQAASLGKDAALLPLFQVELAPDAELDDWWSPGWRTRHPQHGEVEPEEEVLLEEVYFPAVLAIARAYHERGVRLGAGSDVGNSWMTPGVSLHHELGLFQEAGIPPLEVLCLATRNGAEALGLAGELGTIEPGKRADLVVLRADPSVDIRATRAIVAVIQGGRRVEPAGAALPPARR